MIKTILGASALTMILSFNAFAAEQIVPAEEVVSSEIIGQRQAIAQKKAAVSDINKQIKRRSDVELREYIRNSNALNKMINPDAKTEHVDIKDKNAVSKFMQNDAGLPEKIIETAPAEIKTKTKTKYQSKASQVLR